MVAWRGGTDAMRAALVQAPDAEAQFSAKLAGGSIPRVPGTTVFLTRSLQRIPRLVIDHVHFAGALPQHVITLSVVFEDTPRIVGPRCAIIDPIGDGVWHVVARFGFIEIPDLRAALKQAQGLDAAIDLDGAIFVASRDLVVHRADSRLFRRVRLALFAFLLPQRREDRGPLQSAAAKRRGDRAAGGDLTVQAVVLTVPPRVGVELP